MKDQIIQRILDEKIFAVLRLKDTSTVEKFVEKIIAGGITIIEVTLNSGNALDVIERLVHTFPKCLIGAGTVIGKRDAESAVAAGAKFLVSPVVDSKMIRIAHENDLAAFSGAFTPTEVHEAQSLGADFVKIFPLAGIGPSYIKALRGPLPNVRYVATNGVTLDNLPEFFAAGCSAIGLGSALITDEDVEKNNFDEVNARTQEAVRGVML
ncbi:MAG TPA: bifunctional 4-hydroxy-2-oxoglutarate aldolase/2-dehydro-3-deoxy-phosphogluconate aldolase [Candidatus Kapabacteria bacterium]|nr:bifunctional 4-hydroxy-2-oxoglutarate aldolase/2-dehydro-3-deoxy-phosphogluconate aldolase [Candidatus Kapabacteria bacterium]